MINKTKIQTKLSYIEDNESFEINISETAHTALLNFWQQFLSHQDLLNSVWRAINWQLEQTVFIKCMNSHF